MIGKIITGKSFKGCLKYCLNDKVSDHENNERVIKNRAEVLLYNLCFGNEKELIQQFNEVRNLNQNLSKPVMHVTLSFAPGEQLPKYKLSDICEACAKEMGFAKNQFVAIYHNDTNHQHVHIVANRIGFDGNTLSDSNNYKKIADYCRHTELKYHLRQVLSPKKFLPKELRQSNRQDQRKDKLKNDIKECLLRATNYQEFEQIMKGLKYEVIKSRGIAFRDKQKVYTKGSEVGFSLSRIEKVMKLQPVLKVHLLQKEQVSEAMKQKIIALRNEDPISKSDLHAIKKDSRTLQNKDESNEKIAMETPGINLNALDILMANEQGNMSMPKELIEEQKQKRKLKQRRSM